MFNVRTVLCFVVSLSDIEREFLVDSDLGCSSKEEIRSTSEVVENADINLTGYDSSIEVCSDSEESEHEAEQTLSDVPIMCYCDATAKELALCTGQSGTEASQILEHGSKNVGSTQDSVQVMVENSDRGGIRHALQYSLLWTAAMVTLLKFVLHMIGNAYCNYLFTGSQKLEAL